MFRDYEINDKATLRCPLSLKLDLQGLRGDYQGGLQTIESLRSLEEKPAAKLMSRVIVRARLRAAVETQSSNGPAFVQAFVKHYREAIDPLPWNVVQDEVKESYRGSHIRTRAVVIGLIRTGLDATEQKSGALNNQEAWSLVSERDELQFSIPLNERRSILLLDEQEDDDGGNWQNLAK